MNHAAVQIVIQLSVILVAAKLGGYIFKRYLKMPQVLGEITSGLLIGPYALGRFSLLTEGPLFPLPVGGLEISPELSALVTLSAVTLLFMAGLETDAPLFIRFSGLASLVAIGGFVVSFVAGLAVAYLFLPSIDSLFHPSALFWGILATATSVSLTARILTENQKMSTGEASTILAAAVLDDVMGIIFLAIAVGIARTAGVIDFSQLGLIAAKALGFWIGTSLLGLLLAPLLVKNLKRFHSFEIIASFSFGTALFLAGLAESMGLSMVVGAYITGLSLSQTDISETLTDYIHGFYLLLVPIFFVHMGMLVDWSSMTLSVLFFGLSYTTLTILSKVIGCGTAALLTGFNMKGALRIGVGMVPRGEVTLIIAGIGMSLGVIAKELFGVVILLLLISSTLAPPLISNLFKKGNGYRKKDMLKGSENQKSFSLDLPSPSLTSFLSERIVAAFREEEFYVTRIRHTHLTHIKKDQVTITMEEKEKVLQFSMLETNESLVYFIVLEEVLSIREIFESIQKSQSTGSLEESIAGNIFKDSGDKI